MAKVVWSKARRQGGHDDSTISMHDYEDYEIGKISPNEYEG